MKILHVVPTIHNRSAGTTEAVISICEAQAQLGHKVDLFTLSYDVTHTERRLNGFSIKYFKRSSFPHIRLGRSKDMYKALMSEENRCDIVHSHLLWMAPCYYAGLAAQRKQTPYVCSPHGSLTKYALRRSKQYKAIALMLGQKKALEAVQAFHVTSDIEGHDLDELGFGKLIKNIALGVRTPQRDIIKSKHKKIVFLSRIHPKKGIDLLIDAFLNLAEQTRDWTLAIAGPVEDEAYFKTLIEKANYSKRIEFLGPIFGEEKYRFLGQAWLFVLPTHSENFGLVVGEALSVATPVICTTGAPWQALNSENCGWWIESKELEKTLSEALNLSDHELLEKGKRGKLFIEENFSWRKTGEELCKLYDEISK